MLWTSEIEISKSALEHNFQFIKNRLGKNVQFSSVVKGNAYGHGIEVFVPLAENCGVNHFSVFSADEALRVQKSTLTNPTILIMGMLDNNQLEWAIKNGIEFFVFELDRLKQTVFTAKRVGIPAKVHIEVETGMNRTGFSKKEIPEVMNLLKQNMGNLEFKGLCTHFAGAESIANFHRIKSQKGVYRRVQNRFINNGLTPQICHTACSAAMLRYPKTQMDLVRVGILQYGFFPNREALIYYLAKQKELEFPLERLISWKSKVMSMKVVKAGEFVGYGTSFLANTEMKIATIPIGYSHGFSRSLSNRGRVLIRGFRVSVVGNVNMNMMCVDVTNVGNVEKGDEVVLIGRQGDLEISVASFSENSTQLNYELLTRLPGDIPRKIVS
jgi:alanine racemase